MNSLGDRIRFLRNKEGLSMAKLAEAISVRSSNISDWENNKSNPSSSNLLALSNFFNVSSDWLLTGKEKDIINSDLWLSFKDLTKEDIDEVKIFLEYLNFRKQYRNTNNESADYTIALDDDPPIAATKEEPIIYLPILGDAAAGIPIEIIEIKQGEVPVSEKHGKYNSFVIRAKGNSMIEAGIGNGDLVVIRPQPIVENGEIALVDINGEATIKYFYLHNGKCELRSANPSYAPMFFTCENISILGKVVEVIRHK